MVICAVKTHKEIRICQSFVNESLKDVVPVLLFTLQVLLTMCNYGTARYIALLTELPMIVRLKHPSISLVAMAGIITVLSLSCQVFEGSDNYLHILRQVPPTSKLLTKVLKAQRPIKAYIGSFCHSKRSTKASFFCSCIDSSVNALLLF